MDSMEYSASIFGPIVYKLQDEPEPVRTLFYYIMAWILVHDEQARLVSTREVEGQVQFLMQMRDGRQFSVTKPVLSDAEELILQEELAGSVPMMV